MADMVDVGVSNKTTWEGGGLILIRKRLDEVE